MTWLAEAITSGESVAFRFRDANTRAWLRDVGSVLELYVYKACLDAGVFNDIISTSFDINTKCNNNMQFYNDGRSGSSMGADYDENGNLLYEENSGGAWTKYIIIEA